MRNDPDQYNTKPSAPAHTDPSARGYTDEKLDLDNSIKALEARFLRAEISTGNHVPSPGPTTDNGATATQQSPRSHGSSWPRFLPAGSSPSTSSILCAPPPPAHSSTFRQPTPPAKPQRLVPKVASSHPKGAHVVIAAGTLAVPAQKSPRQPTITQPPVLQRGDNRTTAPFGPEAPDPSPQSSYSEDSADTISTAASDASHTPPSSSGSGSEFECNSDVARRGVHLHGYATTTSFSPTPRQS